MRRFAVVSVLVVVMLAVRVVEVSASQICESALPGNIHAGMLEQSLLQLLQQSDTVRQQCRQIAAMPRVRVVLFLSSPLGPFTRARATITHFSAGAIRADVTLGFAEDMAELLPHEFEHILEQAEGVRLRDEALNRRAWMLSDGAYETQRAIDAGRRARREVDALAAEPAQADRRKPPAPRHPFH